MVVIIIVGIISFCFLSVLAPRCWKYLDYPLDKYPSQSALVLVLMSNCTPSFERWPKDVGLIHPYSNILKIPCSDTCDLPGDFPISCILVPSKASPVSIILWFFFLLFSHKFYLSRLHDIGEFPSIFDNSLFDFDISYYLWFLSTVYLRAAQYIFFFHKLAKWFALLGNQKSINNNNFPGKSTCGLPLVGCYFLFQGIFPTRGLNPGLPHCRQTLWPLSYQWSPNYKNISNRSSDCHFFFQSHSSNSYCLPVMHYVLGTI